MPPRFAEPRLKRCTSPKARIAIAFGLSAIYATCFVAIKAGIPYAPPLRFGALRLLIAGVALLGLVWARREPMLPPRRVLPWLVTLALSGGTATYAAMFLSPKFTDAGIASVLGNLQPLVAVALGRAFLGERITRSKLAALTLGLAGVVAIAYPALTSPKSIAVWGAMLALVASVSSATASVVAKHLGTSSSLLAITAWSLVLGSLPLLAASAVVDRGTATVWSPVFLALLFYLALAGTSLTTAVWYWLVQQDDVGRLTTFLFLVPILGLGMAVTFYGERLGLLEEIGVALMIAGIGAVVWESHNDPQIPQPPKPRSPIRDRKQRTTPPE